MFYHYCSTQKIIYSLKEKLPESFHQAMNFSDEIFVYWGDYYDLIAEDFFNHTALLAFNKKGENISAIGFGSETYSKLLKSVQRISRLNNELIKNNSFNNFEELYYAKEDFIEALDAAIK